MVGQEIISTTTTSIMITVLIYHAKFLDLAHEPPPSSSSPVFHISSSVSARSASRGDGVGLVRLGLLECCTRVYHQVLGYRTCVAVAVAEDGAVIIAQVFPVASFFV